MPVTSDARLTSDVATAPAVALRKPLRVPSLKELEATSAEVEAVPVTARLVVVAFVVVLLVALKFVVEAVDRLRLPPLNAPLTARLPVTVPPDGGR
jgi:hypothetical protein